MSDLHPTKESGTTMTPLRKRTIEIGQEYDAAREQQSEKVAVAQLCLAFARVEAERDELQQRYNSINWSSRNWTNALKEAQAEQDALRAALQLIAEPPRTDWMPGEYPLVINKMREVARTALENPE